MLADRISRPTRLLAVLAALVLVATLAPAVDAHQEREGFWPFTDEREVPELRTESPSTDPYVVVAKDDSPDRFAALPTAVRERNERLFAERQFTHIQEAIDWVNGNGEPGYRIKVLPGLYREEPSRVFDEACAEEDEDHDEQYEYEDHLRCPHVTALIHILGQDEDQVGEPTPAGDDSERFSQEIDCRNNLCDLQIEGTGAHPLDVVIDGGYDEDGEWEKENGIRADRADGLVLHNLTVQRFGFNGIYVLETDGYRFDRTIARWNDGYAYLNFVTDNGMYVDCEGYGSGDGALYPGSQPPYPREPDEGERWISAFVENCEGHRNMVGLSGSAGNALMVRGNRFFDNATGWQTDSFVPDHPGMPTRYSDFTENEVFRNNMNYYIHAQEEYCQGPPREWGDPDDHMGGMEQGTVCPLFPMPVGTGSLLPAGNEMHYYGNDVHDNWRNGFKQFHVPALFRGEEDPLEQQDNSHGNEYRDNRLGFGERPDLGAEEFDVRPNGLDFWWDDQGEGNCWEGNTTATGDDPSHNFNLLFHPTGPPDCEDGSVGVPLNAIKSAQLVPCLEYDRDTNPDPTGCDWQDSPEMPDDREVTIIADRLAGGDRIATAIDVSQAIWADGADAVVIARDDDFPDALVGGPLAAMLDAPILLTPSGSLHADVAGEISRLGPERIYILGGTTAISPTVEAQLDLAGEVFRVGGGDRHETAVEVAKLVGGPIAYVANAWDTATATGWADAISASASGGVQRRPVLLTAPGALPSATADAIDDLGITDATVVGGEAAVSDAVFEEIAGIVERADRLGGADRFETARLLAERSRLIYANDTDLWLATGQNWPDALVAASAVGATRGVMLLVGQAETSDAAADWADSRVGLVERIRTIGGTHAISDAVSADVRHRVDPDPEADDATDDGGDDDGGGGPLPIPLP